MKILHEKQEVKFKTYKDLIEFVNKNNLQTINIINSIYNISRIVLNDLSIALLNKELNCDICKSVKCNCEHPYYQAMVYFQGKCSYYREGTCGKNKCNPLKCKKFLNLFKIGGSNIVITRLELESCFSKNLVSDIFSKNFVSDIMNQIKHELETKLKEDPTIYKIHHTFIDTSDLIDLKNNLNICINCKKYKCNCGFPYFMLVSYLKAKCSKFMECGDCKNPLECDTFLNKIKVDDINRVKIISRNAESDIFSIMYTELRKTKLLDNLDFEFEVANSMKPF